MEKIKLTDEIGNALLKNHEFSVDDLNSAMQEFHEIQRMYDGALPIENMQYEEELRICNDKIKEAKSRGTVMGRRIDLMSLLRDRDENWLPKWSLVNQSVAIGYGNGSFLKNGCLNVGFSIKDAKSIESLKTICTNVPVGASEENFAETNPYGLTSDDCIKPTKYIPFGLPPIPPRIRTLLTDDEINREALLVAILFKPIEWNRFGYLGRVENNDNLAMIVEWKTRPGEYYILAMWNNQNIIEEFIQ